MKTSNLQMNCIKFCKSEGIFHINPDLIICLNGKFVAFAFSESVGQRLQIKKLLKCGGCIYHPHTLGEFVETIRQIQEEQK